MGMVEIFDLIQNVSGLLGLGLLSQPALYAAKYASLRRKLLELKPITDSNGNVAANDRLESVDGGGDHAAYEAAKKQIENRQTMWTPIMSFYLVGGTVLSAFAYLVGVVKVLAS